MAHVDVMNGLEVKGRSPSPRDEVLAKVAGASRQFPSSPPQPSSPTLYGDLKRAVDLPLSAIITSSRTPNQSETMSDVAHLPDLV